MTGLRIVMISSPDVSIIIVSYNVRELLCACVESIIACVKSASYEIIVVDNCSNDSTVEMLRSSYPDVLLVANKENRGFAKANNQGIELSKGRYLLLLNPDTLVAQDPVAPALEFMEKREKAGAISYRLLNADRSVQTTTHLLPNLRTEFYHFFGVKRLLKFTLLRPVIVLLARVLDAQATSYIESYDSVVSAKEVQNIPGALMFLRRKAMVEVGLFDEEFFLYSEDADLCKRIGEQGWKIFLLPSTPVIHYEGQSLRPAFGRISPERYSGEFYYFKKHYGRSSLIILRAMLVTSLAFRVVYGLGRLLFRRAEYRGFIGQLNSFKETVVVSFRV